MPKATATPPAFDASRCSGSATAADHIVATAINAADTITMEDAVAGKVAAIDMAVADLHAAASAG